MLALMTGLPRLSPTSEGKNFLEQIKALIFLK